ncbi:MAG: hypothetical protein E6Q97_33315 [Desulfurellales bacterium]|nr:MAG: hypothetical protein E6Q97_33315 [Desulfurellales bacterium]
MRLKTVEAARVRVGDYIFNATRTDMPDAFKWVRVVRVERTVVPRSFNTLDGAYPAIELVTTSWSTFKHPREAVQVRREA